MAWSDDINNLIHQHVKPYEKAAQLSHAVQAIAWDVVNRQMENANRLDEVIDEKDAEIKRLRDALLYVQKVNPVSNDIISVPVYRALHPDED